MKQKKIITFSIILVIAVLVGAFSINQYTIYVENKKIEAVETKARLEEEARIAEEARIKAEEEAKLKAEEAARLKAEEEARLKAEANKEIIQENTFYTGKKGAVVYDQYSGEQSEVTTIAPKTAIYVLTYIQDESGNTTFAEVSDQFDGTVLGYVPFDQLVKTPMDLIANPYEDADYTAFGKNEDFVDNPAVVVKGAYMTGNSAATSKLDTLIDLLDKTELNALVIDVKDDNGFLLFYSEAAEKYNPKANEHIYIKDMQAFMDKLKAHDIYLIARIVTFKSPLYARANPDKAIVYAGTSNLYSDSDGLLWASAHNRELWDYNIGVAQEAAKWGFNEIQFDYVRFPAISKKVNIDYRNPENESQTATIQKYLMHAYEELKPYNVYIAADVFGWAATSINDVGIGQHWEAVTNVVDYICPMMYPSHYGTNNFGLSVPDAFPYETIDRSLKDAFDRNTNVMTPARIRPWIQDFTAGWVKGHISYGAKEVGAQIKALEDNGIHEFLLWNAKNNYSEGAFKKIQ
ncbi:putative glycoside hydrolase [Fusibacter sp. 3D3]|uniref:putative glycoside hydrolase n=1 Tax=Fusibacter sp. 3D3 TaxID=1048380 RepID=UPI000858191E|nr:putative glycoside hydrolase [Fusibacter sp. 3D3]GAU76137.1 predicted glycoside hydrolase [Fusibacter sp. 3D3]